MRGNSELFLMKILPWVLQDVNNQRYAYFYGGVRWVYGGVRWVYGDRGTPLEVVLNYNGKILTWAIFQWPFKSDIFSKQRPL